MSRQRNRTYTRWTPELDRELDRLLKAGHTFGTASAYMDIGEKALQSRYRKRGLVHPSEERKWTLEEDETLYDERMKGLKWHEVAAKLPRKGERACAARFHRMKVAARGLSPLPVSVEPSEPRKFSFQ